MQVDKIFNDSDTAIDSRVQTFVLCAIGAALAAGPMGFELGVYGQLFFHRIYTSWFLVTAVLISLAVVPAQYLPFPRKRLLFLLIPSVWMCLRLVMPVHSVGEAAAPPLFVLGMISYLFCLPYAAYLIVLLVKPELLGLPGKRPKIALVGILVLFFTVGYTMGSNHARFLTCEDFAISGNQLPANCTRADDD